MASEIKKEDLIEKHCELVDVFNGYKECIDLKYALMLEQELKLAGTMLSHITAEDDSLQLEHMKEYLSTSEEFLANLWKGKMIGNGCNHLVTVWNSINAILEQNKDKMELKYSSSLAAELRIADSMIRTHVGTEKMAGDHIYRYLLNIDTHMHRVLNLQPDNKPKK